MAEGAMTRTAKSNLLPLLEGAVPPVEQPPWGGSQHFRWNGYAASI